jgi:hypothetical protein
VGSVSGAEGEEWVVRIDSVPDLAELTIAATGEICFETFDWFGFGGCGGRLCGIGGCGGRPCGIGGCGGRPCGIGRGGGYSLVGEGVTAVAALICGRS